jgi:hypothetical protein
LSGLSRIPLSRIFRFRNHRFGSRVAHPKVRSLELDACASATGTADRLRLGSACWFLARCSVVKEPARPAHLGAGERR